MEDMIYHSFFDGDIKVNLRFNRYMEGDCVYLGLTSEEDGFPMPFADLTVNLPQTPAPEGCGYLDTNDLPNAEAFVTKYGLGTYTGINGQSGFCEYPLYRFDIEKIKKIIEEQSKGNISELKQEKETLTENKEEQKMSAYVVKPDLYFRDNDSSVIASGLVKINEEVQVWAEVKEYTDKETGEKKELVSFPYSVDKDGNFNDRFFFVDKDLREKVETACKDQAHSLQELAMERKGMEHDIASYVTPLKDSGNHTLALANIVVDKSYGVKGIKVFENAKDNRNFVNMPQYEDRNGNWRDQVSILNGKLNSAISEAVLGQYENVMSKAKEAPTETR